MHTVFVDDLASLFISLSVHLLLKKLSDSDLHHDAAFLPHGMTQNRTKAEILVRLIAEVSVTAYRDLKPSSAQSAYEEFRPLFGLIRPSLRYLGPRLQRFGKAIIEIQYRIKTAENAWLDFLKILEN